MRQDQQHEQELRFLWTCQAVDTAFVSPFGITMLWVERASHTESVEAVKGSGVTPPLLVRASLQLCETGVLFLVGRLRLVPCAIRIRAARTRRRC